MPRGDRTGPWGQGPMTGRGMGYCAGYAVPGYANPGFGTGMGYGRGFGYGMGAGRRMGYGRGMGFGRAFGWRGPWRGRGRGMGFGWGYGYRNAMVPPPYAYGAMPWGYEPPAESLDDEERFLKDELESIKERLQEIEDARKRNKNGDGKDKEES